MRFPALLPLPPDSWLLDELLPGELADVFAQHDDGQLWTVPLTKLVQPPLPASMFPSASTTRRSMRSRAWLLVVSRKRTANTPAR